MVTPTHSYKGEPCCRYVVEKNERLPEEHRQHYLARGEDPDNRWDIMYSFVNREDAENTCQERTERAKHRNIDWQSFRVRDMEEGV